MMAEAAATAPVEPSAAMPLPAAISPQQQHQQEIQVGGSHPTSGNPPPPTLPSSSRAEDPFVTPANNATYGGTLMEPITLEHIRNVTELDDKRKIS